MTDEEKYNCFKNDLMLERKYAIHNNITYREVLAIIEDEMILCKDVTDSYDNGYRDALRVIRAKLQVHMNSPRDMQ